MELWIATGNKGKVTEYKLGLKELAELKIFTQADIPSFTPRPEDGKTFLENAQIKARTVQRTEEIVAFDDAAFKRGVGVGAAIGNRIDAAAGPANQDGFTVYGKGPIAARGHIIERYGE